MAYTEKDHAQSQADKEFIKHIKHNHFDLGDREEMPGQYLTEQQAEFQNKGDPSKIRSQLDQEQKANIRASHFKIGNDTKIFTSTAQASFQP